VRDQGRWRPLSTSTAAGGFADGETGQDPITDLWEDDNTG
jgi:hypothetical protein